MYASCYVRFMRGLGWVLLARSILVMVVGVVAAFSFANVYGWGGIGDVLTGAEILVLAAVPAVAGWLVLRIGRKAE